MKELFKQWDDGRILSVTYNGDGDGSAIFSSETNEGIDKEMYILFRGAGLEVERKVKQEGRREVFEDFTLSDGGTFNVVKYGL